MTPLVVCPFVNHWHIRQGPPSTKQLWHRLRRSWASARISSAAPCLWAHTSRPWTRRTCDSNMASAESQEIGCAKSVEAHVGHLLWTKQQKELPQILMPGYAGKWQAYEGLNGTEKSVTILSVWSQPKVSKVSKSSHSFDAPLLPRRSRLHISCKRRQSHRSLHMTNQMFTK